MNFAKASVAKTNTNSSSTETCWKSSIEKVHVLSKHLASSGRFDFAPQKPFHYRQHVVHCCDKLPLGAVSRAWSRSCFMCPVISSLSPCLFQDSPAFPERIVPHGLCVMLFRHYCTRQGAAVLYFQVCPFFPTHGIRVLSRWSRLTVTAFFALPRILRKKS